MKPLPCLFIFLLGFCLPGCRFATEVKPPSIGRDGELVFVADDSLYKSEMLSAIINHLTADYPCLPQSEPRFTVTQLKKNETTDILLRHQTIIQFKLSSEPSSIRVIRDVYALDQLVISISAEQSLLHDPASGNALGFQVVQFLEKEELNRTIKRLLKDSNQKAQRAIKEQLNIRMNIPSDYIVARETDNFIWLRRETTHSGTGIMIGAVPLNPDYNAENILNLRDSLTSRFIPGPSEGTYMTTNRQLMPVFSTDTIAHRKAFIIRGLWRVHGDFMGGPFVTLVLPDPENNRCLLLDGYVYAPRFDKRDYIRRLMAILYTVKVNGESENL